MSSYFEYETRLSGLDVDGAGHCKASALLNHLQNAAALAAVEALAGELSGRIAAAKAEAAGEAVTAADVKIRAAVAAHNRAEAAHPTHLSVIKKS